MFGELNKGKRTVREGINTKELAFVPLADYIGQTIKVDGYFFTNSKYGKQVVVVGCRSNINMPKRAVQVFEAIDANPEMVAAVLAGKLGITDIKLYHSDNGNDTISFVLADL